MKNILVIGSLNVDFVIHTNYLPQIGETVTGYGFKTNPGGKGANQAVAASRLGGNVKMLGTVGNDIFGTNLIGCLDENNVGIEAVSTVNSSTGVAVITVYDGDNHIILDKGANEHLTIELINKYESILKWADIVIFQLEIPVETILYAARVAKKHGAIVVLNPAPVKELPDELYTYTDILIPNESEAANLLEAELNTIEDRCSAIAKFKSKGIEQVIITLGKDGCIYNDGNNIESYGAYNVETVDTTAAGDSFIAAICTSLAEGKTIEQAVSFATAVSAIVVGRNGAIPSLPTKNEVLEFIENNK